MTELHEHAIAEVKKLPDMEQDAIAALILEELEDEVRLIWFSILPFGSDTIFLLMPQNRRNEGFFDVVTVLKFDGNNPPDSKS